MPSNAAHTSIDACVHAMAIMGIGVWVDAPTCINNLKHSPYQFSDATITAAVQQRRPKSKSWPSVEKLDSPPEPALPRRKRRAITKPTTAVPTNVTTPDSFEPPPVEHEGLDRRTDLDVQKVIDCIIGLDECQVPLSAGAPTARSALRQTGHSFGNDVIAEAVRQRQQRQS